eukprot:scaffold25527_cov59-Phaeocystis_antarctica.AAC.1
MARPSPTPCRKTNNKVTGNYRPTTQVTTGPTTYIRSTLFCALPRATRQATAAAPSQRVWGAWGRPPRCDALERLRASSCRRQTQGGGGGAGVCVCVCVRPETLPEEPDGAWKAALWPCGSAVASRSHTAEAGGLAASLPFSPAQ